MFADLLARANTCSNHTLTPPYILASVHCIGALPGENLHVLPHHNLTISLSGIEYGTLAVFTLHTWSHEKASLTGRVRQQIS
jgi:hypothetical protein